MSLTIQLMILVIKNKEKLVREKEKLENIINCTLVWLRNINEENLTKSNVKILMEEIYTQEKMLGFTEFSQYNFNFFSTLNDQSFEPPKYTIRGNYDCKVNVKSSGVCFSIGTRDEYLERDEEEKQTIKYFRPIKYEFGEETKADTCYPCKINTKLFGLIDLKFEDLSKVKYELPENIDDFKIIRTPISNRTYIIGGKDHKSIKELCLKNNDVIIKLITKSLAFKTNEKYDMFEKIEKLYSLVGDELLRKLETSGEIDNYKASELKKLDELIDRISDIDIDYYAQKFMRTCGYLYRMLDNCYHSIGIINKGCDENTITYIIKFVLNASSNLNGELGNADVLAANKVFKTTDAEKMREAILIKK